MAPDSWLGSSDVFRRGYQFGPYRLFPSMPSLWRGEKSIHLTPTALRLLIILVERHGEVVTKDDLLRAVWFGCSIDENNLATHVSALRRILGADAIKTIHGRGYQFGLSVVPLAEDPGPSPAPEGARVDRSRSNLLTRPGMLIGRALELGELERCVNRHRLVTLVGPGGIGKTRLAVTLGLAMLPHFADGVWLVDLALAANSEMVVTATATVLGVTGREDDDLIENIAAMLHHRQILLIYDNCDYVAGAVAETVDALLARAPGLSVLATSQEQLRSPSECIYRLEPLAVPPESAADVEDFPAIQMFVERAQAVERRFVLGPGNAAAVAEICRRLDGIPLALEMASALLPVLGINGLRSALDERFQMLTSAVRAAEPRHRTLRAMVEWSHGLLEPTDQVIFRRLGIFPCGFSLDAAISVTGPDVGPAWQIRHAFSRLIGKSLVALESQEPPRYRLLETVRLYATEMLDASGEGEPVAERHARYFTGLFDLAFERWEHVADQEWLEAYRPDIGNGRRALEWSLAKPDRAPVAIQLVGAAARLLDRLGAVSEARRYIDLIMPYALANQESPGVARLLRQAGNLWQNSNHQRALMLYERSAALYRQSRDLHNLASSLCAVGSCYTSFERYAEAKTVLDEAAALLTGSVRFKSLFTVTCSLGVLSYQTGDNVKSRRCITAAIELAKALNDVPRRGIVLQQLAELEFAEGFVDLAIERGGEAVRDLRSGGRRSVLQFALANLASYLTLRGRPAEARGLAEEALLLASEDGGFIVWICLQLWALLGALDGKVAEAAQLLGFVDAGYSGNGQARGQTEVAIRNSLASMLQEQLSPAAIQSYAAEGSGWPEQRAVALVFDGVIGRVH